MKFDSAQFVLGLNGQVEKQLEDKKKMQVELETGNCWDILLMD